MSAEIVPFPLWRRAGYLRRQAAYICSLNPAAGERHIARQLEVQRKVLMSRGVTSSTVEAELAALRIAMAVQMFRGVYRPGGAA